MENINFGNITSASDRYNEWSLWHLETLSPEVFIGCFRNNIEKILNKIFADDSVYHGACIHDILKRSVALYDYDGAFLSGGEVFDGSHDLVDHSGNALPLDDQLSSETAPAQELQTSSEFGLENDDKGYETYADEVGEQPVDDVKIKYPRDEGDDADYNDAPRELGCTRAAEEAYHFVNDKADYRYIDDIRDAETRKQGAQYLAHDCLLSITLVHFIIRNFQSFFKG